jgi:hypothetical protein
MTTPWQIVRCIKSDIGDLKAGAEYCERIAATARLNPCAAPGDANAYAEAAMILRSQIPVPPKIKTEHVFPPIPDRRFDWSACYDDQDETGPFGWGPTEEAAIKDLQDNYDEPA